MSVVQARHTVILACDPGEHLRPLTSKETPTALLTLGDRRTLLGRSIARLGDCIATENIWAIVRTENRARVGEELDRAIHVLSPSGEEGNANAVSAALAKIEASDGGDATVLLHPATHVISDETRYRASILACLDEVERSGKGIALAIGESERTLTGIQIWPVSVLRERLCSVVPSGETSLRDWLTSLGASLATVSLGKVGWMDIDSWDSVRALLEYVEKPWGHERLWALNEHYAGKVLFIRASESLSLQYHETKDETIRIASGRMRFRVGAAAEDLESLMLEPGMSYHIPPRCVHQMEAVEDCTVIEVSTPHLVDVVRIEDRYGRA